MKHFRQNPDLKILVFDIHMSNITQEKKLPALLLSHLLSANVMCCCRQSWIVPINTGTDITETSAKYRTIQHIIS